MPANAELRVHAKTSAHEFELELQPAETTETLH